VRREVEKDSWISGHGQFKKFTPDLTTIVPLVTVVEAPASIVKVGFQSRSQLLISSTKIPQEYF